MRRGAPRGPPGVGAGGCAPAGEGGAGRGALARRRSICLRASASPRFFCGAGMMGEGSHEAGTRQARGRHEADARDARAGDQHGRYGVLSWAAAPGRWGGAGRGGGGAGRAGRCRLRGLGVGLEIDCALEKLHAAPRVLVDLCRPRRHLRIPSKPWSSRSSEFVPWEGRDVSD